MAEAKTEVVALNTGSLPWDSAYNTNAILINMVTDNNGRLFSLPVNQTIQTFLDYSTIPANDDISILAIIKSSRAESTYFPDFKLNQFYSDYAIITTRRKPQTWTPAQGLCVINILRIDELNHTVISQYEMPNSTDGTPNLVTDLLNRGDFSYAQNSANQSMFVDDSQSIWYFEISTAITAPAKLFKYADARVQYLVGNTTWGTLGNMGSNNINSGTDGILSTDITGTINYLTLLTYTPSSRKLIVNVQDYGVIYDEVQNLFFFTEQGDFSKILFQYNKWPKYNRNITMTYSAVGWTSPGSKGEPLTYPAPGRVIDMVSINSSLYVFTQDGIYRYNLVIVNNNPTLQQDNSFNMHYRIRPNSNALFYQNAMYFISSDDKLYGLNPKGAITELTTRILPDKYYFSFNQLTVNSVSQNFYSPRVLHPMKAFNMNCIVENYSMINLDTGNFCYILPNVNNMVTWSPSIGVNCLYDQPKRITASDDTGRYIALQNILQYVATDFDNNISNLNTNLDYFSCGVLVTKQFTFSGSSNGKLAGISITLRDSNLDPAIYQTFDAITLGIYIIKDNAIDINFLNNVNNDAWWAPYNKTFNRRYSTNVFEAKFNIDCQSFIICIRFSNFSSVVTPTPQFELQKFGIENIMLNIMS